MFNTGVRRPTMSDQENEGGTQLVFIFLSIDLDTSHSVMDNVSKMSRCPIHLNCKIAVPDELRKSTILQHVGE
jgi:hypothetical protein